MVSWAGGEALEPLCSAERRGAVHSSIQCPGVGASALRCALLCLGSHSTHPKVDPSRQRGAWLALPPTHTCFWELQMGQH